MVEYNPRESKLSFEDTTEDEILKLRSALNIIFGMLSQGHNLNDIQRYANSVKASLGWPFKSYIPLEMPTGDEEE
tara:strand:- start:61 stop:285 length:225 start_codon:yes stop_codon:yes gene_type:complete